MSLGKARKMVELSPSKGALAGTYIVIATVGAVLVLAIIAVQQPGSVDGLAATETAAEAAKEQPPQDPEITEVASGVFHLDFGGELCDTARCLGRAAQLVNEWIQARVPRERIVSVAPLGVYGSPTALVVIIAPAQQ